MLSRLIRWIRVYRFDPDPDQFTGSRLAKSETPLDHRLDLGGQCHRVRDPSQHACHGSGTATGDPCGRLRVQAKRETADGERWSAVFTLERVLQGSEEHTFYVPAVIPVSSGCGVAECWDA